MIEKEIIYAEEDLDLWELFLYWIQWMIARNLRDIASRRAWLDEMSIEFANHSDKEFRFKNGVTYELPDLDMVFGDDEDMRWMSDYLACDGTNLYPRHKSIKTERLRVINLFLKLRYPQCRQLLSIKKEQPPV